MLPAMADIDKRKREGSIAGSISNPKPDKISKTNIGELMTIARRMWNRDPEKVRAYHTEDREFRELFGCSASTACNAWELLIKHDLIPEKGNLEHFLWALMQLKVYGKERTMCALAGGVDAKTYRKWTSLFIEAIGSLELFVVSSTSLSLLLKNCITSNPIFLNSMEKSFNQG